MVVCVERVGFNPSGTQLVETVVVRELHVSFETFRKMAIPGYCPVAEGGDEAF